MLPGYIIEELLKKEREKRPLDELYIERPEILDIPRDNPDDHGDRDEGEAGVVIIDYTI